VLGLAGSFYFFNHYHPWVGEFIKVLNWKGIPGLLDPNTQALNSYNLISSQGQFKFSTYYAPDKTYVAKIPYYTQDQSGRFRTSTSGSSSRTIYQLDYASGGLCLRPLQLGDFLLCSSHDRDPSQRESAI
jgi:hypothetical protein